MNKRINYEIIIEQIKKHDILIITQKWAKKIVDDELPKSCYNLNYLKSGKNSLGRFLMENKDEYDIEIIPAQIIIKRKEK